MFLVKKAIYIDKSLMYNMEKELKKEQKGKELTGMRVETAQKQA